MNAQTSLVDELMAQLQGAPLQQMAQQLGASPAQTEDAVGRVRALAPHFETAVHSLKGVKHVADIRNYGLAAGFTVEALPGEPAKRPYLIAMDMLKKGFYVRYGGDTIQLAPPFVCEKAEIDRLVNALGESFSACA